MLMKIKIDDRPWTMVDGLWSMIVIMFAVSHLIHTFANIKFKQIFMTKKIVLCLLVLSFSLSFVPATSKAESANTMTATAKEQADARAMVQRLNEIKQLTKSNLSWSEKKKLRKEVRAMQEKMKSMRPGIYLSVAAIIIILLLLILIL
jgi:hypothetical protein